MSENEVFFLVSASKSKYFSSEYTHWGLYKSLKNAKEMQRCLSDQGIYKQVFISAVEIIDKEQEGCNYPPR